MNVKPQSPPCFHCGGPALENAPRVEGSGEPRTFCCTGCAAAAQFIHAAGLDDYYRLRRDAAPRVRESEDSGLWDNKDWLEANSRALDGGRREITVLVDGMRCAACAWLIDQLLRRESAVHSAQVNAVSGRMHLLWYPKKQALGALLSRIEALGYRVYISTGAAREAALRRDNRLLLMRLGVAGLVATQAMMFAEALYLDGAQQMPASTRDFFRWLAFALTTPVVFFSGMPFLRGLLHELSARRPGMDTLVGGSILIAYFASLVQTLRGGANVWFDAAVMFVLFLLCARALEHWGRQRANAAVDRLSRSLPQLAQRRRSDGSLERVPVSALAIGDTLFVPAGGVLPADGVALSATELDEALLSGESRPLVRAIGAEVLAGCVCPSVAFELRVTRTGADTRLSAVLRLVEQAQRHRPRSAQLADALAARLVPVLLLAAAVTFGYWWRLDGNPNQAFEIALAVLVVSCPCALSLATPLAVVAAQGSLASLGVLSRTPDALERLARIEHVVFDKTGTLTEGQPQITAVTAFDGFAGDRAWALAAALEQGCGHPLARAFPDGHGSPLRSRRELPGCGIEAEVIGDDGTPRTLRLGRAGFACGGTCQDDAGALWLGDGQRAFARFDWADELRPDAVNAIAALRRLGLSVSLLSGDAELVVKAVAERLGIAEFTARCTPEEKLDTLRRRRAHGQRVAMIGDGINDAPVLAGAEVSIALGSGSPNALRAADLVLSHVKLTRIAETIELARRTYRVIRQNLAWAVAYNLIAIPLAASGFVAPWLAALGMAGSSAVVTLNALRLAKSRESGVGNGESLEAESGATVATPAFPNNDSRLPSAESCALTIPDSRLPIPGS